MQIPWEAIRWWEARRIVFNFILFLVGVLSIVVLYLVAPEITILSAPGAAGVILYGLAANVCYTIGWITEWAWSSGNTNLQDLQCRPDIFCPPHRRTCVSSAHFADHQNHSSCVASTLSCSSSDASFHQPSNSRNARSQIKRCRC